jgi:iron complex outermembrane receptor protein
VIGDVSNDRVFPLAPKNTYSASIDWTLLRTDFGNYRMVLDADHTDSYYLYPYSKNPAADQVAANNKGDARTLLNARLALENVRVGSTTLEFALWGKNLTDKEYVATTLDFGPALASMRQAYYGDPRTYGIDIAVKW